MSNTTAAKLAKIAKANAHLSTRDLRDLLMEFEADGITASRLAQQHTA